MDDLSTIQIFRPKDLTCLEYTGDQDDDHCYNGTASGVFESYFLDKVSPRKGAALSCEDEKLNIQDINPTYFEVPFSVALEKLNGYHARRYFEDIQAKSQAGIDLTSVHGFIKRMTDELDEIDLSLKENEKEREMYGEEVSDLRNRVQGISRMVNNFSTKPKKGDSWPQPVAQIEAKIQESKAECELEGIIELEKRIITLEVLFGISDAEDVLGLENAPDCSNFQDATIRFFQIFNDLKAWDDLELDDHFPSTFQSGHCVDKSCLHRGIISAEELVPISERVSTLYKLVEEVPSVVSHLEAIQTPYKLAFNAIRTYEQAESDLKDAKFLFDSLLKYKK